MDRRTDGRTDRIALAITAAVCIASGCMRAAAVIFTALHEMQARTSYEKGVCLSLRPSAVCQTRDL